MTRLNGKTAVITGGATGIGLAAAKRFIEEGAFVFIFGRRQEALDAAVADLGPNARAVKGSVSDEADLDRLYAAVKAERGTSTSSRQPLAHGIRRRSGPRVARQQLHDAARSRRRRWRNLTRLHNEGKDHEKARR